MKEAPICNELNICKMQASNGVLRQDSCFQSHHDIHMYLHAYTAISHPTSAFWKFLLTFMSSIWVYN